MTSLDHAFGQRFFLVGEAEDVAAVSLPVPCGAGERVSAAGEVVAHVVNDLHLGQCHAGTIPLLNPADTAIFDEDVLADMERHADDVIPCAQRDATAVFRISMRCCGAAGFLCAPHRAVLRFQMQLTLAMPWMCVACGYCDHAFTDAKQVDEVIREVPL